MNTLYYKPHVLGLGVTVFTSMMATVFIVLIFQVSADEREDTDTVARVIPYNGYLEFQGEPITATNQWFRFDIEDWTEPGAASGPVVYSQTLQVDLYEGQFTAVLGPSDDEGVMLEDTVSNADDLHIRITVLGDYDPLNPLANSEDDVTLSNPLRLSLTPHAVWVTDANDFDVQNNLQAANIDAVVYSSNNLSGWRGSEEEPYSLGFQRDVMQTVLVGTGPDEQQGSLFAIDGASANRSLFKAGKLTIDSVDGAGLANLVSGAYKAAGANYNYISDGVGASRIQMNEGSMRLFVDRADGQGQVKDQSTGWEIPALELNSLGVTINLGDSFTVSDDGNALLTVGPSAREGFGAEFSDGLQVSSLSAGDAGSWVNATFNGIDAFFARIRTEGVNRALFSGSATFESNISFDIPGNFNYSAEFLSPARTTFNAEVNGVFAADMYIRECSNSSMCICDGIEDMAVTGGAWSGNTNNSIVQSEAVSGFNSIAGGTFHGWQV